MIIAAAIKFGDLVCHVPKPGRHHNVLNRLSDMYGRGSRSAESYGVETQGFLTDSGEFLNRREAMQHALDAGQTLTRREGGYNGLDLYSEDLW